MKLIDKKGRLFGRLNIIDFIIAVMIAAVGAAIVTKFGKTPGGVTDGTVIEYTVRINMLRNMSVDAFAKNTEDIVDAETKKELGDITDMRTEPGRELIELADGTYEYVEYPDKFTLYLTVKSEGSEADECYYLKSGKRIVIGDTLGLNNGYVQSFGEITEIEAYKE